MLRDAERRTRVLPWMFGIALRPAARHGQVLVDDEVRGVARWLPPKAPEQDATLAAILVPFRFGRSFPRLVSWGRAMARLRKDHEPEAAWTLGGIGVDPPAQGRGVGAGLVEAGLRRVDAAAAPCFLLTNNEANLRFYERFGFAVVAETETPAGGPPAWAMTRPRR